MLTRKVTWPGSGRRPPSPARQSTLRRAELLAGIGFVEALLQIAAARLDRGERGLRVRDERLQRRAERRELRDGLADGGVRRQARDGLLRMIHRVLELRRKRIELL